MTRPFVNYALEHPAYYRRGPLAYHPTAGLTGGRASCHIRGDLEPPVSECGVAGGEPHRGHGNSLAYRNVADRGAAPLFEGRYYTSILAPEVHPGLLPKPEAHDALAQTLASYSLGDLNRAYVARLCEDISSI